MCPFRTSGVGMQWYSSHLFALTFSCHWWPRIAARAMLLWVLTVSSSNRQSSHQLLTCFPKTHRPHFRYYSLIGQFANNCISDVSKQTVPDCSPWLGLNPPPPPSSLPLHLSHNRDQSSLLDKSVFAGVIWTYVHTRANLFETGVVRVIWAGHSSAWFATLELTVLLLPPTSTLYNISTMALS